MYNGIRPRLCNRKQSYFLLHFKHRCDEKSNPLFRPKGWTGRCQTPKSTFYIDNSPIAFVWPVASISIMLYQVNWMMINVIYTPAPPKSAVVMFSLCLCVCLPCLPERYIKMLSTNFDEICWGVGHVTGNRWSDSGVDPDHDAHTGTFKRSFYYSGIGTIQRILLVDKFSWKISH